MNIYRTSFVAECPVNHQGIIYSLEIYSTGKILVEHITTACRLQRCGFHEDIADELFRQFGGHQVLRAHHHGVDIETVRRGAE